MNVFKTNGFLDAARQRKHYYFGNLNDYDYDWNLSWDYMMEYLDSHPELQKREGKEDKKLVTYEKNKKRFMLLAMEQRPSTPLMARNFINQMKETFHKNPITLHSFMGLGRGNTSFEIHRDGMDVLYVQTIGETIFSIWKSKEELPMEERIVDEKDAERIFIKRFKPGDAIWIPRQTFHYPEPVGSRVGFSFGVEDEPDPSEYI